MKYKCPYCDNIVMTNLKPCKYCGGEASKLQEMYTPMEPVKRDQPRASYTPLENAGYELYSSSTSPTQMTPVNTMLVVLEVMAWVIPYIGTVFAIICLCMCNNSLKQKDNEGNKLLRVVRALSIAKIVLSVVTVLFFFIAFVVYYDKLY